MFSILSYLGNTSQSCTESPSHGRPSQLSRRYRAAHARCCRVGEEPGNTLGGSAEISIEASSKNYDSTHPVIQPRHGLHTRRKWFVTEVADAMVTEALFLLFPIAKLWDQFTINFLHLRCHRFWEGSENMDDPFFHIITNTK